MYFLVLLTERPDAAGPVPDHESFIDSLIERQLVLLGGPIDGTPSVGYVLRSPSLDEASAVVATDPLVSSGAFTAAVVQWELVGIDLRVVDDGAVLGGGAP